MDPYIAGIKEWSRCCGARTFRNWKKDGKLLTDYCAWCGKHCRVVYRKDKW